MKTKNCPKIRQMTLALDDPVFEKLTKKDRAKAVSLLALLLLEASGAIDGEEDNEDR